MYPRENAGSQTVTMRKQVNRCAAAAAFVLSVATAPAIAHVTLAYSDWQLAEPV